MGIFSMILGVAMFLGFTGAGCVLASGLNGFLAKEIMGQTWTHALNLPANVSPVPIVIVCAGLGFVIGFSFFMKGLIYNRIRRLEESMYSED